MHLVGDLMSDAMGLPVGNDYRFGCLRSLRLDDAPAMIEWMHDPAIAKVFQANFQSMEIEDAERFIETSWSNSQSLHLAIDDENGGYLGTVSLKGIDLVNLSAEYAISMRHCAHGTGVAMKATNNILMIAFDHCCLHRVWLDVREDNQRAIRFYNKVGFEIEGRARDALRADDGYHDLLYYSMLSTQWGR